MLSTACAWNSNPQGEGKNRYHQWQTRKLTLNYKQSWNASLLLMSSLSCFQPTWSLINLDLVLITTLYMLLSPSQQWLDDLKLMWKIRTISLDTSQAVSLASCFAHQALPVTSKATFIPRFLTSSTNTVNIMPSMEPSPPLPSPSGGWSAQKQCWT